MKTRKKAIQKPKGPKSKNYYNLFLSIAFTIIFILCVRSCFYQKERMQHTASVTARIVWTGKPSGIRVGPPQMGCEYFVKGVKYEHRFPKNNIDTANGWCLEVRYSVEDPLVAEPNYAKGSYACAAVSQDQ